VSTSEPVVPFEKRRGRGRPQGSVKKSTEEGFECSDPTGLKKNYLIKTPIARLDKSAGKQIKVGRKRKYTITTMRNGINKYFEWCEQNDRVPSVKGLTIHLKMHRDQFYQYLDYPEFRDIMEGARLIIAEWIESDIYRTPGAAAGKIAYAKNLHGWTDRIDTTNTNYTEIKQVKSVDEAKAIIASLAPLLMEHLQGQTLKQIVHDETPIDAVLIGE
jgi:hypothetical protein